MIENPSLVSIGIPTYNRAELLKRAIESALNQDYKNIEVIISDNASTDDTESICQFYCNQDARLKYVRHSQNRGPGANFSEVLKKASGQFFMWLGDDDWIDEAYVSSCIKQLIDDSTMALISGTPKYYCNGQMFGDGKVFCLLYDAWWRRVISYYKQVADNGMFYGLMRTAQIRQIEMPNTMGGDWLLIANIVSMGKSIVIPEISVHRELGGATTSYQQIVATLGISKIHAIFPMLSIAVNAWLNIVAKRGGYKARSILGLLAVGCAVFIVVMLKPAPVYISAVKRRVRKYYSKLVG
jgi:glycosyltransferase involved in cell wall biosynthesis